MCIRTHCVQERKSIAALPSTVRQSASQGHGGKYCSSYARCILQEAKTHAVYSEFVDSITESTMP